MRWKSARRWPRSRGNSDRPDLQDLVRQGEPHFARLGARHRAEGGAADPRRGARKNRPAGADRHSCARAMRAGRRGGRCAADPGVFVPADRSVAGGRGRPASRSTSRRASSWRRGTCRTSRRRSPRPATSGSCCASAARALATTRSSSICARCRSWRRPATRWCSTPPMRWRNRAASATARAGSANSARSWRARRSQSASPPSSSRPTRTPTMPAPRRPRP